MRKLLTIALAGASVVGGAIVAEAAQAQPYGYYPPAPSYYGNGYYAAPRPYAPYTPYNGYAYRNSYGDSGLAGIAGALLGSAIGADGYNGYGYGMPYDQYGPDPNGTIAPDGHRIKCKLRRTYDSYYRGDAIRRVCW
jgi:hypothetical protein